MSKIAMVKLKILIKIIIVIKQLVELETHQCKILPQIQSETS